MNTDQYQFFKNAQYRNTRNEKKTLVIAILDDEAVGLKLGNNGEFDLELFEPLKIDKHSEVYLDNFISINSNTSAFSLNDSGFCLNINEFNINSGAASASGTLRSALSNSIFIPNEHNTLADNHVCILHKSKKFNYVCDINPCKLGRISGKITNLAGETIFHGTDTSNLFTYTLVGITSPGTATSDYPRAGQTFTLTFGGGGYGAAFTTLGSFLSNITASSSVIHFTTQKKIKDEDTDSVAAFPFNSDGAHNTNNDSMDFNIEGGGNFQINLSTNNSATLINAHGGFVAEFLIISKE